MANFHQGLGWVAQLAMFLTLGLLVFPSQLGDVAVKATALALVLALVARPLAVWGIDPARPASRSPSASPWAGAACAARCRWCWPRSRCSRTSRAALEFLNIVFFAVIVSTLLQGTTFEPVARRLKVTASEPALPPPLIEAGTVRELGADVIEHTIGADDAIVGARVRDLGLPREAVVNVLVRGDEAIPPRGSTRLQADDRLHVLVRQEAMRDMPALIERWGTGPIGPTPRPPRKVRAHPATLSVRPWPDEGTDRARPELIFGEEVVDLLRIRRDHPGALALMIDGRYAITSPVLAVGGREDLMGWARRRLDRVDEAERSWLQTVIGALAADLYDRPA